MKIQKPCYNFIMIFYIFLAVGLAVTIAAYILQLVALKNQYKKKEAITKPLIVAGLILASVMFLVQRLPDSRNILIWTTIGLLGSFAGDILLLKPENKVRLITGALGFITSNVSFLILLSPSLKLYPMPFWGVLIFIAFYALIFALIILVILGKQPFIVILGMACYFTFACFLNYEGALTFIGNPSLHAACFTLGIATLIASDIVLAKEFTGHPLANNQFIVMIIYPISQLLLATGSVLMSMNI